MPNWMWKFWPLKNYGAITLPWGIFYNPSCPRDERIVRHEQKHVEQIKTIGVFKFYGFYLIEYVRNLLKFRNHKDAYENISFEIEARKAE